MAATREETSRVAFCEAWVEFVITNAGDWAEQNGGGETVRKSSNFQSTQVFCGLLYIATMQLILLCDINFAEVNVRIFADTISQSIQMVSQIFLSFLFIFLFIFFFGYFLGWSIGGVCGPARKVVHGPGVSVFGSPLHELSVDTAPTGAGHVLTSCV